MGNKRRARILSFGALALVAALLPAGLVGSAQTTGDSTLVYLTLGSTDRVTWMSETQTISGRNNCSVTFGGSDILDLTTVGGPLGFVKDGFGVKSTGDGTGEPCGRVEASDGEAISVSLGSDLDGYLMTAIDVDLELKFNAAVVVTFKRDDMTVHTPHPEDDPFTGTGGSDDGPDSGDGDNFRLFVRSPVPFDEVVFEPISGSMTLEGGADGTDGANEQLDESSNSSQFEVVQAFDGEITCNDTERIEDEAVPGVLGEVTMFAMEFDPDGEGGEGASWHTTGCLLKPFNESVSLDSIFFMPELEGTTGRYTIRITAEDQFVETDGAGQITSLIMLYDPEGDSAPTLPLMPCEGQPILIDDPEDVPDAYGDFWTADNVGLLPGEPGEESACYYDVALTPTGENLGTEVWDIYFEDDPGFNFR